MGGRAGRVVGGFGAGFEGVGGDGDGGAGVVLVVVLAEAWDLAGQ